MSMRIKTEEEDLGNSSVGALQLRLDEFNSLLHIACSLSTCEVMRRDGGRRKRAEKEVATRLCQVLAHKRGAD
jgi:hypothetical protein